MSLEEEIRIMAEKANEAREKFAMAFLAETGLMPSQAEMHYGQRRVGDQVVFRVWFVAKDEAEELSRLRELCAKVATGADCKDEAASLSLLFGASQGVPGGH